MTVRNVRNVTFRSPDTVTSASGVSIDTGRSDATVRSDRVFMPFVLA